MYIETMQDILTHSSSVILDDKVRGLLPFLPLNDLPKPGVPPEASAGTPAGTPAAAPAPGASK